MPGGEEEGADVEPVALASVVFRCESDGTRGTAMVIYLVHIRYRLSTMPTKKLCPVGKNSVTMLSLKSLRHLSFLSSHCPSEHVSLSINPSQIPYLIFLV